MIALHMIVSGREKPEMLQQCLNSMKNQVHGVFVTVTTPDEKGKKPKKLITAIRKADEQLGAMHSGSITNDCY